MPSVLHIWLKAEPRSLTQPQLEMLTPRATPCGAAQQAQLLWSRSSAPSSWVQWCFPVGPHRPGTPTNPHTAVLTLLTWSNLWRKRERRKRERKVQCGGWDRLVSNSNMLPLMKISRKTDWVAPCEVTGAYKVLYIVYCFYLLKYLFHFTQVLTYKVLQLFIWSGHKCYLGLGLGESFTHLMWGYSNRISFVFLFDQKYDDSILGNDVEGSLSLYIQC